MFLENGIDGHKELDYSGRPTDESDFKALAVENAAEKAAEAAERRQRERDGEILGVQRDFDSDTSRIREERFLIEKRQQEKDLKEKVENLKKEYLDEMKRRDEYAEAERNRGFLKRAWEFLFVPRDASTPDRLNVIALDERVRKSLAAYRSAKKELEDVETSISSGDRMQTGS